MSETPDLDEMVTASAASLLSARDGYLGMLEEIAISREERSVDEELFELLRATGNMLGFTLLATARIARDYARRGFDTHTVEAAFAKARPLIDSLLLLSQTTRPEDLDRMPYASVKEIDELFSEQGFSAWLEQHGRSRYEQTKAALIEAAE